MALEMTKERWQQVEAILKRPYGRVALQCDQHKVDLVVYSHEMKLEISIYIDGKIDWSLNDDNPELARKFWCENKRFMWKKELRDDLLKDAKNKRLSKSVRDRALKDANTAYSVWLPTWKSSKRLCAHLRKHCQQVELIGLGGVAI